MTNEKHMNGKVYLVGAGPGDAGLLTLKGAECLKKADVVIYDYLSDPVLLDHARPEAEKIYVGKEAGRHTLEQDEISELLVRKALERKTIVRLKGGDPFVFGRGGEECETLKKAGVPYEVVPGVTSGIAAPAYAGIPVTHRKVASSVAFITGNEDPSKTSTSIQWEHLAKAVDTLVFYMGVGNLPAISGALIKNGLPSDTPVAIIRWGTKNSQRTVTGTLATIVDIVEKEGLKPPAITVVGNVVKLRRSLEWFENRPFFGKRIVITRSRAQASELAAQLTELGAEAVELPTIDIVPSGIDSALAGEINKLDSYKWIVFTSPNGADCFFELLLKIKGDIRALGSARIASIGPATSSAISRYHVKVDITADEAVGEGLVHALKSAGSWDGVPVLLARAEKGRDILPDTLRSWGALLTVVPAYTTVPSVHSDRKVLEEILEGRHYDLVTFTSSSTFENFISLYNNEELTALLPKLKAASIGPVTSSSLRKQGVEPAVEAEEHCIPGLVEAIKEYFKK